MDSDTARARVAKGAAHLDQVRPGWFTRIDVGTLDLMRPCLCLLGQVCQSYYSVVRDRHHSWEPRAKGFQLLARDATAMGFRHTGRNGVDNRSAKYLRNVAEYKALHDAWIEAIADRLLPTSVQGMTVDAGATPMAVGVTESA